MGPNANVDAALLENIRHAVQTAWNAKVTSPMMCGFCLQPMVDCVESPRFEACPVPELHARFAMQQQVENMLKSKVIVSVQTDPYTNDPHASYGTNGQWHTVQIRYTDERPAPTRVGAPQENRKQRRARAARTRQGP